MYSYFSKIEDDVFDLIFNYFSFVFYITDKQNIALKVYSELTETILRSFEP